MNLVLATTLLLAHAPVFAFGCVSCEDVEEYPQFFTSKEEWTNAVNNVYLLNDFDDMVAPSTDGELWDGRCTPDDEADPLDCPNELYDYYERFGGIRGKADGADVDGTNPTLGSAALTKWCKLDEDNACTGDLYLEAAPVGDDKVHFIFQGGPYPDQERPTFAFGFDWGGNTGPVPKMTLVGNGGSPRTEITPTAEEFGWNGDSGFFGVVLDHIDAGVRLEIEAGQDLSGERRLQGAATVFGLDNMHFTQVPRYSDGFQPNRVTVRSTGQCVGIQPNADGTFDGAPVKTSDCDGSDLQKITYNEGFPASGEPDLYEHFVFDTLGSNYEGEHMCMEYDVTATNKVFVKPCDVNNNDQKWLKIDDGTFRVYTLPADPADEECLTVNNNNFVTTTNCNNNDKKKFDFSGSVREPIINFATTLHSAQVNLPDGDDGEGPANIKLTYHYDGPKTFTWPDRVNFKYHLLDPTCTNIWAEYGDEPKAIEVPRDAVDEREPDKLVVTLPLNLATIEGSNFWVQDDDITTATIAFCAKLVIDFLGELAAEPPQDWKEVNFHETKMVATVDLKEDSGFNLVDIDVNLDRAEIGEAKPNVSVDYPVQVNFCADDTTIIENPPLFITQGFPIQLCVETAKVGASGSNSGDQPDDVYVADIDLFEYGTARQGTIMGITDGVPDVITELNCQQRAGVCRIKFVPLAKFFVTRGADRGTPSDTSDDRLDILEVSGAAVIAFGSDPDRKLRVNLADAVRKLQEDSSTAGVSDIAYEIDIRTGNPRPKNKRNSGAALVGYAAPAVLAAMAFFF